MANYYISVTSTIQDLGVSSVNLNGTSSVSGDKIELRMDTGTNRRQVLLALDLFRKFINQGGTAMDGTNLPINV